MAADSLSIDAIYAAAAVDLAGTNSTSFSK